VNGLVALGLLFLFLKGRETPATKGKGGSPWTTDAATGTAPAAPRAPKAPPRTAARKA